MVDLHDDTARKTNARYRCVIHIVRVERYFGGVPLIIIYDCDKFLSWYYNVNLVWY
jgi:hypothetical protein